MGRITARRRVTRVRAGHEVTERADVLAVEEPLEIRLDGTSMMVTMRTPGSDIDLVTGLLVAEGVITAPDDIISARYCGGATSAGAGAGEANSYNVLDVDLTGPARLRATTVARSTTTTSACGVCGKASIDDVTARGAADLSENPLVVDAGFVWSLPDRLRAGQQVFDKTGGLHAAALFDATSGEMLTLAEDVGRHNAVDKVIGWALRHHRLPLSEAVLQVSGRAGFELVQKAAAAGIPMLSAVSAPSSLAADLAEDRGMTLVGFVRGESMVIYSRPDRIRTADAG